MKWQIVHTNAGWHARFVAANGEIIMWSETYTAKSHAENAISLTLTEPITFENVDET